MLFSLTLLRTTHEELPPEFHDSRPRQSLRGWVPRAARVAEVRIESASLAVPVFSNRSDCLSILRGWVPRAARVAEVRIKPASLAVPVFATVCKALGLQKMQIILASPAILVNLDVSP